MAVYMISDTHFGHKNIVNFRKQFSTSEEHDNSIVSSILSVVHKRDSLYILGDVCVHNNGWKFVEEIASSVDHLHIVLGNHDLERKNHPLLAEYDKVCKSVAGMKRYKNAWLTHAPIHTEELRGKINVHGHVHSSTINDERYCNVSCENTGYKPINFVDIQEGWRG